MAVLIDGKQLSTHVASALLALPAISPFNERRFVHGVRLFDFPPKQSTTGGA